MPYTKIANPNITQKATINTMILFCYSFFYLLLNKSGGITYEEVNQKYFFLSILSYVRLYKKYVTFQVFNIL